MNEILKNVVNCHLPDGSSTFPMRQTSLVIRISLALTGIVALAAISMVTSYRISQQADSDAHAINLSGSLRMQTYRLAALASQPDPDQVVQARAQLESSWDHPVFVRLSEDRQALAAQYQLARDHWERIEPGILSNPDSPAVQSRLEQQVSMVDELVSLIQQHAEANARLLGLVQIVALLAILLLAAITIYWLRIRVERPLSELTRMARRVGQGDFEGRVNFRQTDELGMLASSFNRMSDAIAHMHGEMEQKIRNQTQKLQRSNTTLEFLYDTAKTIIERKPGDIDHHHIISNLAELVDADDIELCLMTESGDAPYLQIKPEDSVHDICVTRNCSECLSGDLLSASRDTGLPAPAFRYSFPMMREQQHYGVLVCRMGEGKTLELWQQQLLQSVADQLALARSLQAQEDNARRLSLTHERTVIARELHDSLAQAMSYLKIQVTRLNRALAKDDKATLEEVSRELHEGLNSAYRQLRELLTTFRLKVDGPGLLAALQTSVRQLSEQTEMDIELDYHLGNLPLTPNEEVHVLQIVREATQNAIHHSAGNSVRLQLLQDERKRVCVSIEDDGAGLPDTPDRLNHYGLAIMKERSQNLGGRFEVQNRPGGGTGVYFTFMPACVEQRHVFAREA